MWFKIILVFTNIDISQNMSINSNLLSSSNYSVSHSKVNYNTDEVVDSTTDTEVPTTLIFNI